ncbi:hypothetical protein HR45_02265 [Shewanella mangrovi]|uniref:TIGR02453 family protein n=1 Tax=Shewanella mangrovi TaxID=1515746 RepID=A0A094JGZ4_9GAMM|nr:DUF2461 domain-containing protein [Shewanella mangrovi]KFZ39235.1 hypothetical protein HR45_02265 [Shewanella mangrovi]
MFSEKSFVFLNALKQHNERAWFKEHQQTYEDDVRTPALQFIEQMQPHIHALSPRLTAVAKKVGGSLMRPQRDTRFSHNKAPYKLNVGIQFRHFQAGDVHAPGMYVHIAEDECFLAAGCWHPAGPELNKIRQCIDDNPNSYLKAVQQLENAGFTLDGDKLQRPPKGFDKQHPLIDELKRKDFIALKPLSRERIISTDFVEFCAEEFQATQQLMAYLCFALELDY